MEILHISIPLNALTFVISSFQRLTYMLKLYPLVIKIMITWWTWYYKDGFFKFLSWGGLFLFNFLKIGTVPNFNTYLELSLFLFFGGGDRSQNFEEGEKKIGYLHYSFSTWGLWVAWNTDMVEHDKPWGNLLLWPEKASQPTQSFPSISGIVLHVLI